MKKVRYLTAFSVLLFINLFTLPAQDLVLLRTLLEKNGYPELHKEQDQDKSLYEFSGDGKTYLLESKHDLEMTTWERLLVFLDQLENWDSLDYSQAHLQSDEQGIHIVIIPEVFSNKGRDLLPYVPSGIGFKLGRDQEYDLRLKIDDYVLRLRGYLETEQRLLERLAYIIADPVQYIRESDPAYAAYRVGELQQELDTLKKQLADFETVLSSIQGRADKSDSRSELLAMASIAALSKGLFSGPKALEKPILERIIAIKKADSSLDAKQIRDILKKEELSASDKQIQAVLAVYFGQY